MCKRSKLKIRFKSDSDVSIDKLSPRLLPLTDKKRMLDSKQTSDQIKQ